MPLGNSVPKVSPIVPLWAADKSGFICIMKQAKKKKDAELGCIWGTG